VRALLLILSLSACATEIQLPKEVEIPVPVPCVGEKDIPAQENLSSDDEILAMEPYDRTVTMWNDRKARIDVMARQDVLLQKCRR
jgi:hypothetical protein